MTEKAKHEKGGRYGDIVTAVILKFNEQEVHLPHTSKSTYNNMILQVIRLGWGKNTSSEAGKLGYILKQGDLV